MDYRRTKQKDNMVHMMSSSDDDGKIDARVHYVNMDNSTKAEPTQGNRYKIFKLSYNILPFSAKM